ncbi:hypothetical protein A2955_03440 [Candidatus Woesebacteria bacterium RIFCSPLOWO2_01_FULL_37_19]|uniref:Uncharacterized protein n=1 Tax=Candidatus Woesebacteria bacterium RIFCSPLOWO2_01_FULL_37_19 TaxID=1802514 RepID=A0A1F8B623_9BACT|nr:MAG: hypothetical protein A2955_03440 [Candidatus Woesebacteria bacterium RIFCSPLOWO2_01_FULL_37_19]
MMVESNKDYENFLEEVYTKDQLAGLIGEIELAKSYVYKKEQSIILSKKIENKVSERFSKTLADLERKELFPSASKMQTGYLDDLKKYCLGLPVCKLVVSFYPSFEFQKKLSQWFVNQLGKKVILELSAVEEIVAGVQIEFEGEYKDLSISDSIDQLLNNSYLGGGK